MLMSEEKLKGFIQKTMGKDIKFYDDGKTVIRKSKTGKFYSLGKAVAPMSFINRLSDNRKKELISRQSDNSNGNNI